LELACDIPKKKKTINLEKSKQDKINKKFKNLNLNNIDKLTDFVELMKNDMYRKVSIDFLKQYYEEAEVDAIMVNSLLQAFCIANFSNVIFDSYKTRFEQKLILKANKLVLTVNKLLNNELNNDTLTEFYLAMDIYLSLFKVWNEGPLINEITKLFDELQSEINIVRIRNRRKLSIINYGNKIKDLIDQLFNKNPKYSIRILLNNYDIFKDLDDLEKYFWLSVGQVYSQYRETLFITLVSELKIKLINKLSRPYDRKKIYYLIDIEDLISKIGSGLFDNGTIVNILNIIGNKIKKNNSDFFFTTKYEQDLTDKNVIDLFEQFYHAILCL